MRRWDDHRAWPTALKMPRYPSWSVAALDLKPCLEHKFAPVFRNVRYVSFRVISRYAVSVWRHPIAALTRNCRLMEPNWLTTGAPCEQIGEPLWLLCRWYIYDMSGQHYGVSSADKLSEARLVMEPSSMIVFRSTKVIPTGVVIIVRDNGSIGSSVHVFMCTLFAWWSGHAVLYEMGRWDGQMRWAEGLPIWVSRDGSDWWRVQQGIIESAVVMTPVYSIIALQLLRDLRASRRHLYLYATDSPRPKGHTG
jgi:hypothetical protein